jgi:hypothetical protein
MRRSAVLLLLPCALLLAASDCDRSSDRPAAFESQASAQPIYESDDLGAVIIAPPGLAEARARFTLNDDELPLAVIVEGQYAPAVGNENAAHVELWVYDTRGDQDPSNDVLAGAQPTGPFARVMLSRDEPGTFTIRTPLGSGCASAVALTGGTWAARLRVNSSSWQGTITSWKLRIVTLKGARILPEPGCFVRD